MPKSIPLAKGKGGQSDCRAQSVLSTGTLWHLGVRGGGLIMGGAYVSPPPPPRHSETQAWALVSHQAPACPCASGPTARSPPSAPPPLTSPGSAWGSGTLMGRASTAQPLLSPHMWPELSRSPQHLLTGAAPPAGNPPAEPSAASTILSKHR